MHFKALYFMLWGKKVLKKMILVLAKSLIFLPKILDEPWLWEKLPMCWILTKIIHITRRNLSSGLNAHCFQEIWQIIWLLVIMWQFCELLKYEIAIKIIWIAKLDLVNGNNNNNNNANNNSLNNKGWFLSTHWSLRHCCLANHFICSLVLSAHF